MTTEPNLQEEIPPIAAPLKILSHTTIHKRFGWWAAVALVESWGRKQVCFYLWQKKPEGGWKRKQKFGIHTQGDWLKIKDAVDKIIKELS